MIPGIGKNPPWPVMPVPPQPPSPTPLSSSSSSDTEDFHAMNEAAVDALLRTPTATPTPPDNADV